MTDWTAKPYIAPNTLHCVDAFELLAALPDASVDLILTDPPYNVLETNWDIIFDLKRFWLEVKRIIKPRGVIAITATQPFATDLIVSNREWFKYEWVWVNKSRPTMFIHAKNCPLRIHENIYIFSNGVINHDSVSNNRMNYYPQMDLGKPYKKFNTNAHFGNAVGKRPSHKDYLNINKGTRYPTDVLDFSESNIGSKHPTQKPVALFEYLIKTYTNAGDLVIDPFVGSGTTAVAAHITGRRFICGDQSPEYIEIARRRVFPEFGKPPKRAKEIKPLTDLPLFEGLTAV